MTTDKAVICRSVVERADSRLVEVDFGDADPVALEPLAPGMLYLQDADQTIVFELHRTVSVDGSSVVFESFRDAVSGGWQMPVVGARYHWRGWIIPDAWDAIQSNLDVWQMQAVTNDHEHCIITWETILQGDQGYYNSVLKEWISIDAFQKFMRDDIYRLRLTASRP